MAQSENSVLESRPGHTESGGLASFQAINHVISMIYDARPDRQMPPRNLAVSLSFAGKTSRFFTADNPEPHIRAAEHNRVGIGHKQVGATPRLGVVPTRPAATGLHCRPVAIGRKGKAVGASGRAGR